MNEWHSADEVQRLEMTLRFVRREFLSGFKARIFPDRIEFHERDTGEIICWPVVE